MQFVLPLQDDGVSQRHSTTLHIMLAFLLFAMGISALGLFWFTWISKNFEKVGGAYYPFLFFGVLALLGATAILLLSIYQKAWLRKENNNLLFRVIELGLLAVGSVLFFLNKWNMPAALFALMAAVVVFAIWREKNTNKAGNIIIDDTGIKVRNRIIMWKDINTVLLRFSTLSIEMAGNKLMQENIGHGAPPANELEAYCMQKVEANKIVAVANDW